MCFPYTILSSRWQKLPTTKGNKIMIKATEQAAVQEYARLLQAKLPQGDLRDKVAALVEPTALDKWNQHKALLAAQLKAGV